MADNATPPRSDDDEPGCPPGPPSPDDRPTADEIRRLGTGLMLLAVALAYLFASIWPSAFTSDTKGDSKSFVIWLFTSVGFETTADVRLILMVMLAGALGSFLHTATSFSDFVGNGKLTRSWMWWYILKPFIGMGLALLFYLVVRGGFLSSGADAGKINLYGIAGLAGMAGMFSKQATDKLDEVFSTVFRTAAGGGDAKRGGDLANDVSTLTDVVPRHFVTATDELEFEVKGTRFVKGCTVRVAGTSRETVFNSATSLTAQLLPTDVASDGELELVVFNPPPGGGTSTPLKLTVAAAAAPQATPPPPPSPITTTTTATTATDADMTTASAIAAPGGTPTPAPAGDGTPTTR